MPKLSEMAKSVTMSPVNREIYSNSTSDVLGFHWADAPEAEKYSVCVHCGLCLETCPTYQELRDENQSPRGRVYLIKEVSEGRLPLNEVVVSSIFTCLDCRNCDSVCPSGVKVGNLIEEARGQIYASMRAKELKPEMTQVAHSGTALERFFERKIFPHPKRLQTLGKLLRFYQHSGLRWIARNNNFLHQPIKSMESILPDVPKMGALESLPYHIPAQGEEKATVALFTGCVMDIFFAHINEATARVAVRNGLTVVVPKEQICCGALQTAAGDREQAREMAKRNIEVFMASQVDYIVVNAAGCGAAMKEYPELFRDDPILLAQAKSFSKRVRDISELLVEVGFEPPKGTVERTITYHDSCHLYHAQRVRSQPREILKAIPGLKVVDMPNSERCCGSGGIYNVTHPEMGLRLGDRKVNDIPDGVDGVAMGNPGCMLQISAGIHRRGIDVDVLHTVELLDEAYQKERND